MRIFYGKLKNLNEPHLVLTFEHIARTRSALADQIAAESKDHRLSQDYIDGIKHVLDTLDSTMVEQMEDEP